MKTKILFICLLFIGTIIKAQDVNSINSTLNNFRLSLFPEAAGFDSPKFAELYDGSPFLQKEWQPGSITLLSGEILKYPLRYFVYEDQIWLKNEKDSIHNLNLSEQIKEIKIADQTFIYTSYLGGDKLKKGILEVLYNGVNCKLLNLYVCKLEKGREANGYQEKEKDKFQLKKTLYYQTGDHEALILPRSKKELFTIFRDKAGLIEKYFKNNKLKMNPEDITEIFSYYDKLMK